MFLKILAAVDASASSRKALEQAVDLATTMNAMLTLITVAPPTAPFVPMAGVSSESMRAELDAWAAKILREAVATVPDEVIVHTVQPCGSAGHEILREIEGGGHDLVVLGSRGRGRAQEGLLGSVNGYLHFHSRIAVLSVPAS